MVGLSPSVAGSDGFSATISGLLTVLSDPKAAKALLEQLNAKIEEARKQTEAANAAIAIASARQEQLETLQTKLDENQSRHVARHEELAGREVKLNQGLAELTNKEAALGRAKQQYLEESAEQSKQLQATAIASNAKIDAAAAKIKEDRDEFERSVTIERNQIAALLKAANSKNEEAQQALADAKVLKEELAARSAVLKKALGEVR